MVPELGSLPFLVSTPESQRSPMIHFSGNWAIWQMIRRTRKITTRNLCVCRTWGEEGHEANQALPSWICLLGKQRVTTTRTEASVDSSVSFQYFLQQSLTSRLPQTFQGSLVQPEQMERRLRSHLWIQQVKSRMVTWARGVCRSGEGSTLMGAGSRQRKEGTSCWSSGRDSVLPMQGDPGSIPCHGTRSHMVQTRVCML